MMVTAKDSSAVSILLIVAFSWATSATGISQVSLESDQRLVASDGAGGSGSPFSPPAGDNFGRSVSIHGDTAVIGAVYHNPLGISHAGAVYVFSRQSSQWLEAAKLVASDASASAYFGIACDIFGDTIVVGANGNPQRGSTYVFVRQGLQWGEQARLDGRRNFGASVAVDRDTLVVGEPSGGIGGVAHVYVREGTTWTKEGDLIPAGVSASANFGGSVALDGDIIAIGARWDDGAAPVSGSVYVFERQGTGWRQVEKLVSADGDQGDNFGAAVSVTGSIVAVGSPSDSDAAPSGGAVYVFSREATAWLQQQKITASDVEQSTGLGVSVSGCGDMLVAGAIGSKAIYVFVLDGLGWEEAGTVAAFDDPSLGPDYFGLSAHVHGARILVGAPLDDAPENDSGAAYTYRLNRRAGTAMCFGTACPCGNTDPSAGCANSTGVGGLLVGTGSRSVSCENSLEFTSTHLPQPTSGLLYMGDTAIAAPLVDGIQCVGGTTYRLTGLMQTVDGAAAITFGPGVLGASADLIDPGETWHFQAFYRDAVGSPCGAGANLTNAYSVTFLP